MRTHIRAAFAAAIAVPVVVACGDGNKPPEEPQNTAESRSASTASTDTPRLGTGDTPPASSVKPVGGDDKPAKGTPCGGVEVPDLLAVLAQASCEVPSAKPGDKAREVKDILEVKAVPGSPQVAPGGHTDIVITFKNKGKGDLPLDFIVDPEPRFDFEVYDAKGKRVELPSTPEPNLPDTVANAPMPEKKTARATLSTQGTAKLVIGWDAVKYKWTSAERAKGGLPGRGYPKVADKPLPKGKYVLKVITPLTAISEGLEHEVSTQKVEIVVGP
jgi:hypothetical protein